MRGAPFYLAWWAAMAAAVANATDTDTANFDQSAPRRLLEPVDVAADRETVAYLLPRLAAKYRPSGEWSDVTDPRFYVLTEMDNDDVYDDQTRPKIIRNKRYNWDATFPRDTRFVNERPIRTGLSITAPIDTLRNRFRAERYRQQIETNRRLLNNLPNFQ